MVRGSVIRFILLGTVAHVALGRWVDSPWLLPDVTLVGIGLAASRSRASWLELTLVAGLLPMLASSAHGWAVGLSYAGSAAIWRWAGSRWDLADGRLSAACTAMLESGLALWWVWRAEAWSWELWAAVPLRVAMTALGWALASRWFAPREAVRHA